MTGPEGPAGPANVLSVGTVTTGEPGSAASAAITGTSPNQLLNLIIPAGSQGPGMLGYATKAALDADLAHPAGTVALVGNDPVLANNGTYIKSGDSGSGSWTQTIDRIQSVSNRVTSLEGLALQAQRGLTKIIKNGSNVYIRTEWDAANDLVQKVLMSGSPYGLNNVVNFDGVRIHPKSTTDAKPAFVSSQRALWLAAQGDDAAPARYNGTTSGGNHGPYVIKQITAAAHGKTTAADIGSEWTDEAGLKWYLMKVIDANTLWVMSEDTGTGGIWNFGSTINGTKLIHSQRATNTGDIIFSATVYPLMTPVTQGQVKSISVDGVTVSADGVYTGKTVNITNSYNIVNVAGVVSYYKTMTGTARAPSFVDAAIPAETRFTVTYQWAANGSCTVYHQFRTFNAINLQYVGFIQSAALDFSGKQLWQYIPKTVAIPGSLKTWNFQNMEDITAIPLENLYFYPGYWSDPNNPPDRSAMIVKTSGGAASVGYVTGLSPLRGVGVAASRKNLVGTAFVLSTYGKNYMYGVSTNGSGFTSSIIPAGSMYEAVAYRSFYNPALLPEATVNTWYRDGRDIVVLIDFHQPVTQKTIPLPDEFVGRKITVVDKTASFSVVGGEFVSADGLLVTVTGGYGYAVLKLSE